MYIVFEIIDREVTDEITVLEFCEAIEAGEQMFINYLKDIGVSNEKIEECLSHFVTEDEWHGSLDDEGFSGISTAFGYEVEGEAFNFWCNVDRDYDVHCVKVRV